LTHPRLFQLELCINSKFLFLTSCKKRDSLAQGPDDAGSELDKYFEDTATDTESRSLLIHISRIYIFPCTPANHLVQLLSDCFR